MGVNLTKEEDGRSRNPDWRIRTQIGSIQGKRLRFLAAKDDCPMGQEVIRAVDEKWEREHEELKEEF